MSFLDKLAEEKIIKQSELEEISLRLAEGNTDVDDILIAKGVKEDVIVKLKSEYSNVPMRRIDIKAISFDVLKYIPEESATYYKFVPIGVTQGVLEVGLLDPDNLDTRDALQFIASKIGMPFKMFVISKSDFNGIINNYKGLTGEVTHALEDLTPPQGDMDLDAEKAEGKVDTEKIIEDAPVSKIVAVILRHATEGGASDIHIENAGDKVKVRFRVDGVLHTSLFLPLKVYAAVISRIKILANLKLDEKRKPQDGRFSVKLEGRKVDIRVSSLPTFYGEKIAMRILDSEKGVKPLDSIGLTEGNLAKIRKAMLEPYGLILVSGPTGSGKTTTLYSMLNELDREKRNVVSLEDPVEYNIPGMNQSQIVPEIGYSFASGLRSILRQDPDVIMVGEIRDKETAELAIQASLTGHMVFATIHTNNAIGTVPRLVDMGIDPYLIAPTLTLSIAQRLVRVACPASIRPVPVEGAIKMMFDKQFADLPEEFKKELNLGGNVYNVEPSPECPSGTRGRVAVFEIFDIDKEVEAMILKDPTDIELWKIARKKGMLTMREDAIQKALRGEIAFQEVNSL
ncbi:MAG: Type II secretion system protein E [Parcubacteria group bacterium LiPW_30]|nr:MAG: Type II secretion system protein E [Parcubacteria group bacterium LiPW_30]